MKIMQYFILVLILTSLFFVAGCGSTEKADSDVRSGEELEPDEETGISDVFEDSEEVSPPGIPD